ncbi:MAG: Trk system potassium transporter TrkA [Flavobacteriaceae bacterium]|nr:Trk system potassium transporter TrkA [Flavobacteriaceae bacterium]
MKIIIAGAGEVGFHLAKLLSYESQEITLIDLNKESLVFADTHLDIKVIRGDATSISVLKEARILNSDLFISVASSETSNITACVLAKQLGAKRTIARISNPEFINHKDEVGFTKFGIDELISPESLAAAEIELLLSQSVFNDTYEFEQGALTMLGLSLSKDAKIINKSVKVAAQLLSDIHFIPIVIQRSGSHQTIIPRGDTVFKDGDRVVFITSEGGDEELCKLTGKKKTEIKDVMILGGGKIGSKTACDLSKSFNIKLVEKLKDRAFDLAEQLPNTLVINGDGRNVALLEEENIKDMDAFISVTGNSETNIMSCLVAKSKGIKKTIALVDNMDYYKLSQSIGIDTLINQKLLAANSIVKFIKKAEIVAISQLSNMNAELLEFVINENSHVCNKLIRDLNFPREAIISGVIRNGNGLVVLGDFKILKDDRVVVCCKLDTVNQVEKFFY